MNVQTDTHIEDLEEAARACRPVRSHGPWRVQIGDAELRFRPAVTDDPAPTGRQILELVEARVPEECGEYTVFQLLRGGELEELRPTETTDLRSSGVERFLVFKGGASYRMELDGREVEWEAPIISGLALKKLADVDPSGYGVWREVRGDDDRRIDNRDLVNLGCEEVERFFTCKNQSTEG